MLNAVESIPLALPDEAHDLERYASDHLGLRVTRAGWNYTLAQIYNARRNKGLLVRYDFLRGGHEALRTARDEGERFFLLVENWLAAQRQDPARMHKPEEFPLEAAQALNTLALRLREGMLQARRLVPDHLVGELHGDQRQQQKPGDEAPGHRPYQARHAPRSGCGLRRHRLGSIQGQAHTLLRRRVSGMSNP